jgi:hypothetical protein
MLDNTLTDMEKSALSDFRIKYEITDFEHSTVLRELGWTTVEFISGYKGGPSVNIMDEYYNMLEKEINNEEFILSSEARTRLRTYRTTHGIHCERYVYIYVYIYINMYTCIYACLNIQTYIFINICIYIYI